MASSAPVLILFGSQTGAARGVAELVHAEALARGFVSSIAPANAYESAGFLSARVVLIIMSTTGAGDPPTNAEEFVRFLRRRTHPRTLLSGLCAAVLGLGDTNYTDFCAPAKTVAKRLNDLGATAMLAPTFADESLGLPTFVEPWLAGLWKALEGAVASTGAASSEAGNGAGAGAVSAAADVLPVAAAAAVEAGASAVPVPVKLPAPIESTMPAAVPSPPSAAPEEAAPVSPMAMMARMRALNEAKARKRDADAAVTAAINASLRVRANSVDQADAVVLSPGHEQSEALERAASEAATREGLREREAADARPADAPAPAPAASTPASSNELNGLTVRAPSTPLLGAKAHSAVAAPAIPPRRVPGLTPGVRTLSEVLGSLALADADKVIPPSAVSAAGKFFPRTAVPSVTVGVPSDAELSAEDSKQGPPPSFEGGSNSDETLAALPAVWPQAHADASSSRLRSRTPSPSPRRAASAAQTSAIGGPLLVSSVHGRCAESPVLAPISAARYLTEGGQAAERRVLALDFDVSRTPLRGAWGPGDAIGVFAPNALEIVDAVVARCGFDGSSRVSVRCISAPSAPAAATASSSAGGAGNESPAPCNTSTPTLPRSTSQTSLSTLPPLSAGPQNAAVIPTWIPGYPFPTVRDVLTWCVDLSALPKKSLLRLLGDASSAETDRDALFYLASRSTGALAAFAHFVEAQRLDVGDLLALFPSSTPSLANLLSALPSLTPRFYSICSSPLVAPGKLTVAFNVVDYTVCGGVRRFGLATSWLEGVSQAGECGGVQCVRTFLRCARTFVPPAALSTPLIMVGPGTGVSPFLSFIEHREARRAAADRAVVAMTSGSWRRGVVLTGLPEAADPAPEVHGESVLFFGNRDPDIDFLFRDELTRASQRGALTALHLAWSRAPALPRTRVPDLFQNLEGGLGCGASLVDILVRQGGHFYVCGSNAMAADVRAALKNTLIAHGAAVESLATPALVDVFIEAALKAGRYAEDKWG